MCVHEQCRNGSKPFNDTQVMGGRGTVIAAAATVASALGTTPGTAAGAAAAEAAARESKAAAHKLRQAKAYAHLLTRGAKAVAYARLQARRNSDLGAVLAHVFVFSEGCYV